MLHELRGSVGANLRQLTLYDSNYYEDYDDRIRMAHHWVESCLALSNVKRIGLRFRFSRSTIDMVDNHWGVRAYAENRIEQNRMKGLLTWPRRCDQDSSINYIREY